MGNLTEILKGDGESTIPLYHLQKMTTFIRGAGVEFLPEFDENNRRKSFIDGLIKANKLKTRIKRMAIRMLRDGRFLLYLRPIGKGYKIQDYKKDQYQVYRDASGDIESVEIIYSYKEKKANSPKPVEMWVKLRITAQSIEQTVREQKFTFEDVDTIPSFPPMQNMLGFIPCIEVLNPAPGSEDEGVSDFELMRAHIEAHDDLSTAIIDNLYFFCNSPLITTRDSGEVTEAMGLSEGVVGYDRTDLPSTAAGYRDTADPFARLASKRRLRQKRLKRVIGNFEEGESIQQLQIAPAPPELVQFTTAYEQSILEMLGGIASSASLETATEVSNVTAQIQANATEKQEALFTNGLCEVFSLALLAEESLFLASGGKTGIAPITDDITGAILERTINYRVGEVYKPSAESLNMRSITARNLMKFGGVSQKAALQYMFPDKRESELDQMIEGGFPSDYLTTAIAMFGQLIQSIDPLTQMPLADSTGVPLAYKLVPYIENNLDYGQTINPIAAEDRNAPSQQMAALIAALDRINQPPETNESTLPEPGSTVTKPSIPGFFDLSRSPILNGALSLFNR